MSGRQPPEPRLSAPSVLVWPPHEPQVGPHGPIAGWHVLWHSAGRRPVARGSSRALMSTLVMTMSLPAPWVGASVRAVTGSRRDRVGPEVSAGRLQRCRDDARRAPENGLQPR
ncbi:conserved hypothetical protein [Parafrankia sp. Ea1.12]|nr:conserved hypothetical protein [Parafrankia sp. Ea1.12]